MIQGNRVPSQSALEEVDTGHFGRKLFFEASICLLDPNGMYADREENGLVVDPTVFCPSKFWRSEEGPQWQGFNLLYPPQRESGPGWRPCGSGAGTILGHTLEGETSGQGSSAPKHMCILCGGAPGPLGDLVRRAAGKQAQASLTQVTGAGLPAGVFCSAQDARAAAEIQRKGSAPKANRCC